MSKLTYRTTTILLFFITCTFLHGQYQIGLVPRKSPDTGVYQKIGYTEIEIKYGSPKLRDRTMLGNLIPYDTPWRAGANNATTISFSEDVLIEGQKLSKGKYAFFIMARPQNKWVAIFSNKSKQWGAFRYDEADDALRILTIPRPATFHEAMEYSIHQYNSNLGTLVLNWGNIKIELDIETNYVSLLEQEVKTRVSKAPTNQQWVIYLQAAEHLLNINDRLDLANSWISLSESLIPIDGEWNPQFYPKEYIKGHLYWTKALLLAKEQNFKDASRYGNMVKELRGDNLFYNKKNETENIDSLLNEWQIKDTK